VCSSCVKRTVQSEETELSNNKLLQLS